VRVGGQKVQQKIAQQSEIGTTSKRASKRQASSFFYHTYLYQNLALQEERIFS